MTTKARYYEPYWLPEEAWPDYNEVQALCTKIENTLVAAGHNHADAEHEIQGFTVHDRCPANLTWDITVERLDWHNTDVRPFIAAYSSALEIAGIEHEIVTYPHVYVDEPGYWATININYKPVHYEPVIEGEFTNDD